MKHIVFGRAAPVPQIPPLEEACHSSLSDIVKRALVAVKVPCTLEPRGLCRGDGKRPDGISIIPWSHGHCLVWDVTCHDTFAKSNLQLASDGAGLVANQAASNKLTQSLFQAVVLCDKILLLIAFFFSSSYYHVLFIILSSIDVLYIYLIVDMYIYYAHFTIFFSVPYHVYCIYIYINKLCGNKKN